MHITRIAFKNFCQHKDLAVDFTLGLNAIVGANGSGKSTILDAAYAALSGDFGRFAGVKEDSICNTAGPREESWVRLEAEHNGTPFTVVRSLRPAKVELVVGTAKAVTKAPEVQKALEEQLGVNRKLLASHVFVAQGSMFDFVSQTDGQRAAAFQVLCGTEKAQKIADAIDAALKRDADLLADVVDDTDELRQRIAELTTRMDALELDRLAAVKTTLKPEGEQKARAVVDARARAQVAASELEQVTAAIAVRAAAMAQHDAAIAAKLEVHDAVAQAVALLEPEAQLGQAFLSQLEAWRAADARRQQLAARHQAAADAAAKIAAETPALDPQDARLDELVTELATVNAEISRIRTILAAVDKAGVTECPTCGTPVAAMHTHLAGLRVALPRHTTQASSLAKVITAIRSARQAQAAHATKLVAARQAEESLAASLAVLDVGEAPEGDEAAVRQALADYQEQAANLRAAQNALAQARQAAAGDRGRLETLTERHDALTASLAELTVSDELHAKAQAALAKHDAGRAKVAECLALLKEVQATRAAVTADLAARLARLERGRRAREHAQRLQLIRDEVMHRQALPQAVAQANLEDLESDVNAGLDLFGSPFWIETGAALTFSAHFPDAPPMAGARLSGGQKGVLAMAFRSALGQLFNAEIGMMALDEPTAWMDRQNVAYLADALTAYAGRIRGRRQVIVITHARELLPAFDTVVDLDEIKGRKA